MAGAGWRDFVPGEVLTAANVQDYLQDQAVMTFASAAARTSAIASPTEGMVSYLKDIDKIEYYSGSAWLGVSVARGEVTATTDASGDVTVTHGLGRTPVAMQATNTTNGTIPERRTFACHSFTSTTFKVRCYRQDTGAVFASNVIGFTWIAI